MDSHGFIQSDIVGRGFLTQHIYCLRSLFEIVSNLCPNCVQFVCFFFETKNTERNGVNEQNTYTTHREKDNFRKS